MDTKQEQRMREDFARYHQLAQVHKQIGNPVGEPLPTPVTRAVRGIDAKYTRLPASDDRREAWRHLTAVAGQWDREPGEMFELVDDLENHHAAGKPLVTDVHLRNHQQVRDLYIHRTPDRTQQQPNAGEQKRRPISRSR